MPFFVNLRLAREIAEDIAGLLSLGVIGQSDASNLNRALRADLQGQYDREPIRGSTRIMGVKSAPTTDTQDQPYDPPKPPPKTKVRRKPLTRRQA